MLTIFIFACILGPVKLITKDCMHLKRKGHVLLQAIPSLGLTVQTWGSAIHPLLPKTL